MGFLGTKAPVQYDVALLLEIVIMIILLLGYKAKRDKKLRLHGLYMSAAVILHTILVVSVMIPSFVIYFSLLTRDITSPGVIVTWFHAIVGILADILGIYIVAEWRFQPPPQMACTRRKGLMKPLLALWLLALFTGIGFYAIYYLR